MANGPEAPDLILPEGQGPRSTPQRDDLLEELGIDKQYLAIWNARLNPPGKKVAALDLEALLDGLEERNALIREGASQTDIQDLDNDEYAPLKIFRLDYDKLVDPEDFKQQYEWYANSDYETHKPMSEKDLISYIGELSQEVDEKWRNTGFQPPTSARQFVMDNLFYNWELDPSGRAKMVNMPLEGKSPAEMLGFEVLEAVSDELAMSPEFMTYNQKYWLGIDKAIETGRIPSEYRSILDPNTKWTENDAINTLQSLGIDPGTNPLSKLDDIADKFEETWESNLDNMQQGARLSGNVEKYFENIMTETDPDSEIGPEDIMPRMGAEELADQEKYSQFTAQKWDFTESIEYNIKALMKVTDKDFGGDELSNLDPNSNVWPPSLLQRFETLKKNNIKSTVGDLQRQLIEDLETSTAGEAYTNALNAADDNPSLEQAFDVFKIFDTRIGDNGETFFSNVIGELTSVEQTEWVDNMSDVGEREKMAKEYLSRIEGVRDNVEASDIDFVANNEVIYNYTSLGEMLADDNLRQTVIDRVQQRIEDQPFAEGEAESIPGRRGILQRILQKELSETDYQAYLSASPEQQMALQGLVGNYSSEAEVLADPEFRRILDENISAGYDTIKEGKRDTLNAEIEERLFEEYQSRGLITEDTSPEFLNHLVKNVFPKLSQKALLGGGVDTEEEITAMLDGLPAYDLNQADFTRQMDPDTPPPVPGLQVSRYKKAEAPPFSLQSVSDDLMNLEIDRPEYARFVQQQMGLPGFAEEWRREGAEQLDQQAVASAVFGSVGEEAFEQQKRRLDQLEASYESTLARPDLTDEERVAAEKRVAAARKQYAREIGTGGGQSPEERARIEKAMEEDYQKAVARDEAVRAENEAREERGEEPLPLEEFQKGEFTKSFYEQLAPLEEAVEGERAKQAALQAEANQMAKDLAAAQAATVEVPLYAEEAEGIAEFETRAKYSEAQLAQMQQEMEAKARAASTLDVGIAGMQKAVDTSPTKWFTTTAFRDEERRRQTTPGMTSREFFESKLPGFEERYKESPFFRMEQQRTERKQAQEEEQKQREYDSQRRRRLRSGFGGRGRTVVTRGRA